MWIMWYTLLMKYSCFDKYIYIVVETSNKRLLIFKMASFPNLGRVNSLMPSETYMCQYQGWGQIRFIKYKYKYKYIFSRVSNTNTNTNTPTKIWSNTNTNTNTALQIQIQIQIHNEAETKLLPFHRWHTKIYCIVRRLFYLFRFHWKLSPKVQSTISLHWFR